MGVNVKDSIEDTTLGAALKQILADISHVKSASEMSDRLLQDLKSVAIKVDDHDKSIILVAKAMEDMNKNVSSFTETLKGMQKESNEFQRENQKIMMKLEQVLENMSKTEPRLQKIEDKQLTGCPSFLGFIKQIDIELKHLEDVKTTLLTASQKNREEINVLHTKHDVNDEKIKVVNNRLHDLEVITEKISDSVHTHTKEFGTWKENMYKALIANAVLLVITIVGAAITLLK